ncbi:MAG TPA: Rne/Rng family ribonuclease [Bryobacteraceae bacterium]|nr:Rne/Rng family ribonuclease [Bryobacteraceae bacterium]
MSKELVISSNRHETKLAILEDDQLVEVYFQRANEYSLAGSIHKGRVTRVLPGMQSAFVDLGLERDTFLYVSDFFEESGEEIERIPTPAEERAPRQEERSLRRQDEGLSAAESESGGEGERAEHAAEAPERIQTEHAEEGDRDRRGRRSRRRRNRGRAFPESKYASAAELAAPAQEPAEEQPEFAVLPGESLAKYRSQAAGEGGANEPAQEEAAAAAQEEPAEESSLEPAAEPADDADIPADVAVIASDSPEELPPANAIPDAPGRRLHENELESVPHVEPGPEAGSAELFGDLEASEEETPAPEQASAGGVEASTPELHEAESVGESGETQVEEPRLEEDEDREIQALILEDHSAEEEMEESQQQAEAMRASANVREQGGRYLHRASRRMRRRMRGGASELAPARAEHKPEHRPAARPEKTTSPSITDLLKEGQEIIVQIAKEPLGQKGARITSHIALPGRYVVYMPTLDHMGVSRKIASEEERQRLKRILQKHRVGIPGGFITRTAAEGRSESEIAADMSFLANLWLDIRQKAEKRAAPALLHHDLDIVQRVLRDQVNESFKAIWVDNEEVYESVLHFLQRFQPAMVSRVKMYTRPAPIFDAFNITQELEKALRPKVWLKSGGYIVINQTEALVAIDVNTGKFVGKSNRLEDTIVKTNTEAIKEIVRQIRLRDLGGIIVIDFIDMDERKNRQKVMQALEEAMRSDRAPYKILQFNDFGLVAITRKRVKQSLERTLCSPCPYCDGAGYVKSVQTIISEILQEAQKIAPALEGQKEAMLRVHPDVAKVLKSNSNHYLEELEEILKRPVLVTSDPHLHHEKFDLV